MNVNTAYEDRFQCTWWVNVRSRVKWNPIWLPCANGSQWRMDPTPIWWIFLFYPWIPTEPMSTFSAPSVILISTIWNNGPLMSTAISGRLRWFSSKLPFISSRCLAVVVVAVGCDSLPTCNQVHERWRDPRAVEFHTLELRARRATMETADQRHIRQSKHWNQHHLFHNHPRLWPTHRTALRWRTNTSYFNLSDSLDHCILIDL